MFIDKNNMRWFVKGMYFIYDKVSFITEAGQPKKTISTERRIGLLGLAGAPDPQTSFELYQLGWMMRT